MKATVISIATHKGGVGKSTSAITLGGILSSERYGKKVLLIDLDSQCNLTKTFIEGKSVGVSVFNVLASNAPLQAVSVRPGLDVLPSSKAMSGIENALSDVWLKELLLRKAIEDVRGTYDFIIIDCPSQVKLETVNALAASDYVLVPMMCDKYSFDGVSDIIEAANLVRERGVNKDVRLAGVFLTCYNRHRKIDRALRDKLKDELGDYLFDTVIRENRSALSDAAASNTDVYSFDPKSNAAQDYCSLVEELFEKIKKKH